MKSHRRGRTDIENTATWVKYTKKLCNSCTASCCSLPVEVKVNDLVRMRLADDFELDENPKQIAKRLRKHRLIDHYHAKSETFTLSRLANGDCIYLDQNDRRCTIYELRPDTCRNHPQVGPKAGYCAYSQNIPR